MGCESIVSVSVEGQMTGTQVNIFRIGRRTDVWDSSRLGLESIVSASVEVQTSWNRVNSFSAGQRADVWDATGVLGILCENKIRVSQLWEHRNLHTLAECAQWCIVLTVRLCAGMPIALTGGGPVNDAWCGSRQGE